MVLRKIKEGLRKIMQRKKKPAKKAKISNRISGVKKPPKETKEILGLQEMVVEQVKFSHPEMKKPVRIMPQDLPAGYNKDRIVLQVRDPWWLHAYWEVTDNTWERLRTELREGFSGGKTVLRVYDVSNIIFDGKNAHRFFDIEIGYAANNWYIDTGGPGRSWCVDLGLKLTSGEFITIVRSNTVYTPIEGPSWITDEEWMVPEEIFGRLYGMGFGLGQSSPVGKGWQERMQQALFSGVLASGGITSAASPVKKAAKERKFWLVVDCELIVYGATEADAKVSVQGREIKLRPDGTFSLRFALPDGKQVIPVQAVSFDEVEERTITPIVTRETKTSNLLRGSFAR